MVDLAVNCSQVRETLLPCTKVKEGDSPLKKRISKDWRLVPAIVTVAVIVLFLVLTIIQKKYVLTACCAIGTPSSLFVLYLIHQFRHLKTQEENNVAYKRQIGEQKETVEEHKKVVKEQEDQLNKFRIMLFTLKGNLLKFTGQNDRMEETEDRFEVTEEALEEVASLFDDHLKRIEKTCTLLGEIKKSAEGDQGAMKENLETLKEQVDCLKGNKLAELGTLLGKFHELLSQEHNQKLFENSLKLEGKIEAMEKMTERYERIAERLEKALENDSGNTDEMRQILKDIRKAVPETSRPNKRKKRE